MPAAAPRAVRPATAFLDRLRRRRRLMTDIPGGSASRTGRSQASNSLCRSSSRIANLFVVVAVVVAGSQVPFEPPAAGGQAGLDGARRDAAVSSDLRHGEVG